MADSRRKEFGERLASLVSEFRDVEGSERSFDLFLTCAALMRAAKGGALTLEDVAYICAAYAKKLVKTGLVQER